MLAVRPTAALRDIVRTASSQQSWEGVARVEWWHGVLEGSVAAAPKSRQVSRGQGPADCDLQPGKKAKGFVSDFSERNRDRLRMVWAKVG